MGVVETNFFYVAGRPPIRVEISGQAYLGQATSGFVSVETFSLLFVLLKISMHTQTLLTHLHKHMIIFWWPRATFYFIVLSWQYKKLWSFGMLSFSLWSTSLWSIGLWSTGLLQLMCRLQYIVYYMWYYWLIGHNVLSVIYSRVVQISKIC